MSPGMNGVTFQEKARYELPLPAPKETKLSFTWSGDVTTLNHKRKEMRS